jgi:hypothetical protein
MACLDVRVGLILGRHDCDLGTRITDDFAKASVRVLQAPIETDVAVDEKHVAEGRRIGMLGYPIEQLAKGAPICLHRRDGLSALEIQNPQRRRCDDDLGRPLENLAGTRAGNPHCKIHCEADTNE